MKVSKKILKFGKSGNLRFAVSRNKNSLIKKLEASDLKANAKNRLISELSKFYILTNSLGWTLQYNEIQISNIEELHTLKL